MQTFLWYQTWNHKIQINVIVATACCLVKENTSDEIMKAISEEWHDMMTSNQMTPFILNTVCATVMLNDTIFLSTHEIKLNI